MVAKISAVSRNYANGCMYFAISLDAPQLPPYPSIQLDLPHVNFHWGSDFAPNKTSSLFQCHHNATLLFDPKQGYAPCVMKCQRLSTLESVFSDTVPFQSVRHNTVTVTCWII